MKLRAVASSFNARRQGGNMNGLTLERNPLYGKNNSDLVSISPKGASRIFNVLYSDVCQNAFSQ